MTSMTAATASVKSDMYKVHNVPKVPEEIEEPVPISVIRLSGDYIISVTTLELDCTSRSSGIEYIHLLEAKPRQMMSKCHHLLAIEMDPKVQKISLDKLDDSTNLVIYDQKAGKIYPLGYHEDPECIKVTYLYPETQFKSASSLSVVREIVKHFKHNEHLER